jgi:hypothetical protein
MDARLNVFLGGTVGENDWRTPFLAECRAFDIDTSAFFNPVLPAGSWNEEARRKEESAKINADVMLFYICDTKQDGNPLSTFSLVEATVALATMSMREPIVLLDSTGMEGHALKVMDNTYKLLRRTFWNKYIYTDEHRVLLMQTLAYKAQQKAEKAGSRP